MPRSILVAPWHVLAEEDGGGFGSSDSQVFVPIGLTQGFLFEIDIGNRRRAGADHSAGSWRLWVMDADGGSAQPLPIDYTFGDEQIVSWGP